MRYTRKQADVFFSNSIFTEEKIKWVWKDWSVDITLNLIIETKNTFYLTKVSQINERQKLYLRVFEEFMD